MYSIGKPSSFRRNMDKEKYQSKKKKKPKQGNKRQKPREEQEFQEERDRPSGQLDMQQMSSVQIIQKLQSENYKKEKQKISVHEIQTSAKNMDQRRHLPVLPSNATKPLCKHVLDVSQSILEARE